jgi:hypothetical protein
MRHLKTKNPSSINGGEESHDPRLDFQEYLIMNSYVYEGILDSYIVKFTHSCGQSISALFWLMSVLQ